VFASIIKQLCTQWVDKRALSLVLGDMNPFVEKWLQISSYTNEVSPIAIVSQYQHITLLRLLMLMGVRIRPLMIQGKDDNAFTY
jgi:hypothetical protein